MMLLSASVASVVGWKMAAHRSLVGIASIGHSVPEVNRQIMNAPDVETMDLKENYHLDCRRILI